MVINPLSGAMRPAKASTSSVVAWGRSGRSSKLMRSFRHGLDPIKPSSAASPRIIENSTRMSCALLSARFARSFLFTHPTDRRRETAPAHRTRLRATEPHDSLYHRRIPVRTARTDRQDPPAHPARQARAPSRPSRIATAWPIPRLAAVTTATLPMRFAMSEFLYFSVPRLSRGFGTHTGRLAGNRNTVVVRVDAVKERPGPTAARVRRRRRRRRGRSRRSPSRRGRSATTRRPRRPRGARPSDRAGSPRGWPR